MFPQTLDKFFSFEVEIVDDTKSYRHVEITCVWYWVSYTVRSEMYSCGDYICLLVSATYVRCPLLEVYRIEYPRCDPSNNETAKGPHTKNLTQLRCHAPCPTQYLSNTRSVADIGGKHAFLPLELSDGWQHINIDLERIVRLVFGTQYLTTSQVTLRASVRVAKVFFQEQQFSDYELPSHLRVVAE